MAGHRDETQDLVHDLYLDFIMYQDSEPSAGLLGGIDLNRISALEHVAEDGVIDP